MENQERSLLVGGRLDKHSMVSHAIFSPRVNVRYNPTESVNLRASYAGGYRAPQAFDEDMHIAVVGGERVRIRLADDLKEERSHSVSLSADLYRNFGSVRTNLLVEGFYTTLNDVFALRVGEEFTHKTFFARRGITRERNARTAVVAHVAERHHLYVYSRAPAVRNVVVHTVDICTGLSHERNTAFTASKSCSLGSLGKSLPSCFLYSALN